MGILFRANSSRREQAFALFFLAWVAMMLFGFYHGFRPEREVETWSFFLALPVGLLIFIPLVLDRHPSNKVHTWGSIKRYSIYFLLLPLCYGLAWAGLAIGAASVATRIFGQQFAGEYTITAKGDGRFRWRDLCTSHAVYVRNLESSWHAKLCPDERLWAKVKVGDMLSAKGRYSRFGIILEEFDVRG